jgi:tetraacyldisaccharide 4'-kinase
MRAPAFWDREGAALSVLLAPLGAAYASVGRLRRSWAVSWRAPVPVICVGNLVAGGAGKTPVALSLGRKMAARGVETCYLSRGYGGSLGGPVRVDPATHDAVQVGDEPLLLAAAAPCWVARDRAAGARQAAAAGARAIVMDDGHQNPALKKDLSLVVIDGEAGFGNGRVIPAGPLREPVAQGLARADAVVILGADRAGVARSIPDGVAVLHAALEPAEESRDLAGATVFAFAGIGRPAKFFATLEAMGCEIAGRRGFPDHHPYGAMEMRAILDAAAALDAVPVTTEKDAVRLAPEFRARVKTVGVEVVWREPEMLDRLLDKALGDG